MRVFPAVVAVAVSICALGTRVSALEANSMPTLDALNHLDAGLRSSSLLGAEGQLRSAYEAAPDPACTGGRCPERASVSSPVQVRSAVYAAPDAASSTAAGASKAGAKGAAGKWALGGAAIGGLSASGLGAKLFGSLMGVLFGGGIVGILLWVGIGAMAGSLVAKGLKKK